MPIQYKIRRGNTSQANSLTLTEGEIYMDLGDNTLRVHDGVTQGGTSLAKKSDLNTKVDKINLPSPSTTVGSGSQIPVITYNAQGQITSTSTATLNIPSNIATETYVQTQISNLVDSSPETLNTLNELAAALNDDPNFATTITNQIGLKANTSSLAAVATSGSYNDLTNKPFIPNLTSQLMNDAGYLKEINFKTINNESIVGTGNISVSGGGGLGGMVSYYTSFNIFPTLPYSGSWTVPDGVTKIKITLTGAGGGGGLNSNNKASGGGAGGSIIAYLNVIPGEVINWVRGLGGLAATTSNTAGSNGGNSSITFEGESTATLSALGGVGGGTLFGGAGGQNIIALGSRIIGHMAVIGQPGPAASSSTDNEYGAATGASSIWGGGTQFYNNEGLRCPRPGTGGAGANGNSARGGGDGVVMIEY